MHQQQDQIVFATDDNLQKLSSAPVLYGDGTFYACTGLFYQLYTIHADVEGQLFPLVFALLPNKTQRTYTRFFTLMKDTIAQIGWHDGCAVGVYWQQECCLRLL
jgi:hypothetical protein